MIRTSRTGTKAWLLGSAILFSFPLVLGSASAAEHNRASHISIRQTAPVYIHPINSHLIGIRQGAAHLVNGRLASAQLVGASHFGGFRFADPRLAGSRLIGFRSGIRFSHPIFRTAWRFAAQPYRISCVPYAREASGIIVAGNAWQWWDNAEGLYARGERPEPGSVLNFRANGRMRLGHVAVVTSVINAREVMVDHANWPGGGGRGGVSHNVTVVDVSEANNWSAVRVELGRGGDFGSIYPTYGFIYNRPDNGVVTARFTPPAPQPSVNWLQFDAHQGADRPWHTVEEVAEAPNSLSHRIDLNITSAATRFGR